VILLTIGTQLPFERLVQMIDALASELSEPVFGQIGRSTYQPEHFEWVETLAPRDFDQKFRSARLVVSHAGIGTILTAEKYGKPLILFPRQARYGEHRNDHQLATCAQLTLRPGLAVAHDEAQLASLIRSDLPAPARDENLQRKRDDFVANLRQSVTQLLEPSRS